VFRFAVEFVRGSQVIREGLTRSQIFLILSIALPVLHFARQLRRGAYRLPPTPAAPPRDAGLQGEGAAQK
jgi:hypothetical protein